MKAIIRPDDWATFVSGEKPDDKAGAAASELLCGSNARCSPTFLEIHFQVADDSFRMQNCMLTRCFKMLFSIRSMNRDFHAREAQFTATDIRGYGEWDQEEW